MLYIARLPVRCGPRAVSSSISDIYRYLDYISISISIVCKSLLLLYRSLYLYSICIYIYIIRFHMLVAGA